jgi:hypothetical protein
MSLFWDIAEGSERLERGFLNGNSDICCTSLWSLRTIVNQCNIFLSILVQFYYSTELAVDASYLIGSLRRVAKCMLSASARNLEIEGHGGRSWVESCLTEVEWHVIRISLSEKLSCGGQTPCTKRYVRWCQFAESISELHRVYKYGC